MKFAVIVLQLVLLGVVTTTSSVVADNSIESGVAAVADEDEFTGNKQRRTKHGKTSPSSRSKGMKKQTRRPTSVPVQPTSAPIPPTNGPMNVPTDTPTAPLVDIPTILIEDGGFATLVTALSATDLVDALSEPGPFTVFAPTDAAFAALDPDLVPCLLEKQNSPTLRDILLYHVANGKVLADQLTNGMKIDTLLSKVDTSEKEELKVDLTNGVKINEATVERPDVLASNGVIHVIDQVLVPPDIDVEAFLEVCRAPSSSITGRYQGHDIEDSSQQVLEILCTDGLCDITLSDPLFSTCYKKLGGFFGGIAIANDVPEDDLDNFSLCLYCKEEDSTFLLPDGSDINCDNGATAKLTGNIVIPPEGGIFREGPGFNYYKTSDPKIKDGTNTGLSGQDDDEFMNINGSYSGIDTDDGSNSGLNIYCNDDKLCDINLLDASFDTCSAINGLDFYRGFGVARNIPQDSLDQFEIQLYCLTTEELDVDINNPSRKPDAILTGNISRLQDGLLRRTGPGFAYYLQSRPSSPTNDFVKRLVGIDVEDGSFQTLTVACARGLCDITLGDASFSTCIDKITGDIYLGGLAIARDIPQDSLDSFNLDLYCVEDFAQLSTGIDFNAVPSASLDGSILFLEDGIFRRTGLNFVYFNTFWGESSGEANKATSIDNGIYPGQKYSDGGLESVTTTCANGICQVTVFNYIFSNCIIPKTNYNPYYNGVGIARNVPEDSLNNFAMDIYCIKAGQEIDFDDDKPTYTNPYELVPVDPPGTLLRLGMDDTLLRPGMDADRIHYQLNSE